MSNDSFSFAGIDLGTSTYGVSVQEGEMHFIGAPKIEFKSFAQLDGGHATGAALKATHLTIPIAMEGDDFDDLRTRIDALRAALSPTKGDQPIIFDYENTRKINGRLESGLDVRLRGGRSIETNLVFLCSDPLFYDVTPSQITNLDGTETIVYEGSAPAPLVITGYSDYAAISPELAVENETTGDRVVSDYALAAYQYLRFDGERQVLEASVDGVVWVSAMASLSPTEFAFPSLEPGSNSLVFEGFANVLSSVYTWTIDWTTRYL